MTPEDYLKAPYARVLIPDDGGYSAEILEFPGCFAQGETQKEAFENLEQAALAWIESSLEQGNEIPPPSINAGYGGKIALRLPRSIHRLASQMAERDGISLNQFLLSAIAARVGAEDLYNRIACKLDEKIARVAGTGLAVVHARDLFGTTYVASTSMASGNCFIPMHGQGGYPGKIASFRRGEGR